MSGRMLAPTVNRKTRMGLNPRVAEVARLRGALAEFQVDIPKSGDFGYMQCAKVAQDGKWPFVVNQLPETTYGKPTDRLVMPATRGV
jgi:hypothetical protein